MTETAFWILTALASGPRHGYAILGDVERLSAGAVLLRVTTLYASLERLEREGRIRSAGDEVVDGRVRRYYEISHAGREQLREEAERLAARAAAAHANLTAAEPKAAPAARLAIVAVSA